ncbi:hypothetical protein MAR_038180 [Mya arenaria]|uniref:Uncharacterized protein n=1 Tax=Mya arenaria TaxID=6604 RepID=A0ABY7FUJ1_MYAAR|nr:hypothetical protein MAR_038180 [Mya arenaria]
MKNTFAEADVHNKVFVLNTGCQDADCLYRLTAEHLIARVRWDEFPYWAMNDLSGTPAKYRFNDALPVVDGYVLPKAPLEAYADKIGSDAPVLIGTTSHEVNLESRPQEVINWIREYNKYQNYIRNTLLPYGDVIAETALKLNPENVHTPEFQLASQGDVRKRLSGSSNGIFFYVPLFVQIHSRIWTLCSNEGVLANASREILSENTTVTAGYHTTECLFWLKNGFFSYSWIN